MNSNREVRNKTSFRAVIFGASGMVGKGVLFECLINNVVDSVTAVVRTPTGVHHEKYREIVLRDFLDYSNLKQDLTGIDACFFCLGVSSMGMNEETYSKITYDYTLVAATNLLEVNPDIAFCYVSGTGTDSSGKGRVMWARVKGKTENMLLALPFKASYMFRPGLIQPLQGIKSRTRLYRIFYFIVGALFPLLKKLAPNRITTTLQVGKAMIHAVVLGYENKYLENRDINILAAREI
jgi:uncharacterized protein YbjT (DUF2867 family)